jgi:hypothetical protein
MFELAWSFGKTGRHVVVDFRLGCALAFAPIAPFPFDKATHAHSANTKFKVALLKTI